MTIIDYYILPYKNYINFRGRTRRKEFWLFVLINIILISLFLLFETIINISVINDILDSVLGFYMLFNIIPFVALNVRRLHDMGKSGWYFFVRFIPFIGNIWLLILLCTDSQKGANKWGKNPKDIGITDEIDFIGVE